MDYASILRVLVHIDGLAKGTADLAKFDAAQRAVAGSASTMGGDIDTAAGKARSMQADVAKATTVASGLGGAMDKAGRQVDAAGTGLKKAATGARGLEGDLQAARAVSVDASAALGVLADDTDDYASSLIRANGMSTEAVDAANDLRRARQTLAGAVGGLLGDESDLAAVIEHSQRVHRDATGETDALAQAQQRAAAWTKALGDAQRATQTDAQRLGAAFGALTGDEDDYSSALLRASGVTAQAAGSAHALAQARSALAQQAGALIGDEDDLASAMQRSHQAHADATRVTTELEAATSRLQGPITQVSSGFSEASLSVAKARDELDRTGTVSRSTMAELANLGSRGVGGLDRDLTRANATVRKAQDELERTGGISRRTARDLTTLGAAGGGAGGGIGAMLGALSAGGGGLSAFSVAALVAIPVVVALVGVVFALVAALGPVAGLAGAAAVGLSAAAQGFGVFKLATMGVADALKEQTSQQASAGAAAGLSAQQQRSAARAIQSAQDGVRTAHDQVRLATQALTGANRAGLAAERDLEQAQKDASAAQSALTAARAAGRRELEDMRAALIGSKDAEVDAGLALERARERLAEVNGNAASSDLDRREAAQAVTTAEHRLADAQRDRARSQKETDDADAKGVKGTQAYTTALAARDQANQRAKEAEQKVADARRSVAEADRRLVDAARNVARATQAVGDAQANAADSATKAAAGAGKLNEAMDALPAPAQAFVRQLISLKPKLDDLRATAAAGFFPGASEGLTAAAKNFEPVKKVVAETSDALGDLSRDAGELVGSAAFGKDIETIGKRNASILRTLGDGALHIVSAMRHVIVAAGPLTSWLANTAKGWAKNADESAKAGRETGKLAGFFERTRDVLERLGSITGHVVSGLLGVGRASKDSGDDMLASIDRAAERFDKWANSDTGQSKLSTFFRESKELIANLIPVLQGVGKATATIGFGPMSAALKIAGPHAEALTYAFIGYKIAAAAATIATRAYTAAQWLANTAMTANPIGLVIVGLALLAGAFILAYKKVDWFREGVDTAFSWIKDHWPLLLAILTGPIGLAVYAIVKYGDEIVGFFTALPGRIVGALKAAPEALKGAGSWTVDQIIAGFKTVTGLLSGAGGWLKNRIVEQIHATAEDLTSLGGWGLGKVVGGFKTVSEALGGAGDWLYSQVRKTVHGTADKLGELGGWVLSKVVGGITYISDKGVSGVSGVGKWLTEQLDKVFISAKDGFTGLGKTVVDWIVSGLKTGLKSIGNFAKGILSIVGKIPGVGDIADKGKDAIDKVIGGLAEGGTFGGAGKGVAAFARGGITAGGYVNKPIVMMGEEAPLHPEWVIPTNPAYRSRALALHQAAGKAIGLAKGGTYAASYFGGHDDPSAFGHKTASGAIANDSLWGFAELSNPPNSLNFSALGGLPMGTKISITYGDRTAKNVPKVDVGAGGPGLGGHIRAVDMTYAVAKALGFGGGGLVNVGFGGGGGGGILDAVGGAISGAAGAASDAVSGLIAKGPGAIIDMLPGVKDLPDWLKGTGRYVLDQVTGWIKDKVGSLIPGGGGGDSDGGGTATGTLAIARKVAKMFGLAISSTWRSVEHNRAVGGVENSLHTHGSSTNPGAVDAVGPYDNMMKALAWSRANLSLKEAMVHDVGSGLHLHMGFFRKGGVFDGLPFGGSFAQGGVVPGPLGAPTAIIAHGGETVVAAGRGSTDTAPQVNFYGPVSMQDERDAVVLAREVGWEIAR